MIPPLYFFQPFMTRHDSVLCRFLLSMSNVLLKIAMQMLQYTT